MRPHTIALLAAALLGCSSPTAKSTFEDMKKAACGGDVPGFFSHVDKTQVAERGKKRALSTLDGAGALGDMAKELAGKQIDASVQQTFTEWEDDIKKGASGDLCKMEFMSADEHEQNAEVKWKTPSGKDKIWTFQRFDKKWLAVELAGVEPPVDEAKECKDLRGVLGAGIDAIAAVHNDADSIDYAGMAAAAQRANDGIAALALRSPGLKMRASEYMKTFGEMAKAGRAAKSAHDSGAKAEELSAQGDLLRTLKLKNEYAAQMKTLCGSPAPAGSASAAP